MRILIVLALGISFGAGFIARAVIEPDDDRGLLVNGAEIQGVVYESIRGAKPSPPACTTDSPTGIGNWSCVVTLESNRIRALDVAVADDGSFTGTSEDKRLFTGCCIDVLEIDG